MDAILLSKASLMNLHDQAANGITDDYAPRHKRFDRVTSGRCERHPWQPSIDAVWPFWIHDGRVGIHCCGNIAVATLPLRACVGTWVCLLGPRAYFSW